MNYVESWRWWYCTCMLERTSAFNDLKLQSDNSYAVDFHAEVTH